MNCALFDLELKTVDETGRVIRGIATTPTRDRRGDILEPLGATFTNPLPLLWHHDMTKPVGTVTLGTATAAGVPFEAELPRLDEPGPLKDRVDEAWQSIKAGLIRSVSIGYRAAAEAIELLADGGRRFKSSELIELSLVTVPANATARILATTHAKTYEAASGLTHAGVSAFPVVALTRAGTKDPMTTAEQITQWSNARAPKVARMQALLTTSADSGATLDAAQAEEYDGLEREIASIDSHLQRLKVAESIALQQATPPAGVPRTVPMTMPQISVKPNVLPGTAFVRCAMALGAAHGDHYRAMEIAKQWRSTTPEVELFLKAAVAPGNTTDATWAGPLAAVQNVTSEFLELLRPATILGKIPNLRKVPFNVSVASQTAGGTYGWVGQGAPKPVTKLGFAAVTLGITKVAGIIILTEELVKVSEPSAEALVRKDMIAGIAQFLDQQFIDPAVAPVAGVSPGSITNGVASTGVSTDDAFHDLYTLVAAFAAANVSIKGLTFIMNESNAFSMALNRNLAGARMFPGMSATGGEAEGITIIGSNAAGTNVVALQGEDILMADDGGVTIDVSREASIQMDSAPMSPPDATVVMRSLWQENLVGLRADRFINWKRGRNEAVKYLTDAQYVPPTPQPVVLQQQAGRVRNGKTTPPAA